MLEIEIVFWHAFVFFESACYAENFCTASSQIDFADIAIANSLIRQPWYQHEPYAAIQPCMNACARLNARSVWTGWTRFHTFGAPDWGRPPRRGTRGSGARWWWSCTTRSCGAPPPRYAGACGIPSVRMISHVHSSREKHLIHSITTSASHSIKNG